MQHGHEVQLTYPSGRAVSTAVNPGPAHGDHQCWHDLRQRQLPGTVSSVYGAEEFLHDGYAYDRNANVTAIADLRFGKGGARSRTMAYDGLDRLTSVASEMYGATGANYAYNVLDDLTQVNVGGPMGRNHHYCYNAKRQLSGIRAGGCSGASLVTLQFDAQGNLQSREPAGGTVQTYRFDFGNRLREVDGVERYRYDGHGRRVLAMQFDAGTVFSQYGLDGRLLYQKSEKTALQTDQVFLGGTLVAIHEKPSVGSGPQPVKYQHTDALGSPVVVTRQDRSRVEESEYEPYGQVINRVLRDGPGYTGHVEDAATGLVYMQQRYYDPMLGVFLSADPVTAYSSPITQFHRYRYANNNPYTLIDPDGRRANGDDQKTTGSNLRGSEVARGMISNVANLGGEQGGGGMRPASVSSADDLPKLPNGVSNGNNWVGESWVPDVPHFTGRQGIRWQPIPESSWRVIHLNEAISLLPAKRFGILSKIAIPNVRYARQRGYYGLEYQRGYRHVQSRMMGGEMQPYRDIQMGYGTLWSEETFWQVDRLGKEYTRPVFELTEP